MNFSGASTVCRSNDLIVSNSGSQYSAIDVFATPYTNGPRTKRLVNSSGACPLTHDEKRLYCADYAAAQIDVYAYPSLTFLFTSATFAPGSPPSGVAVVPAAI